MFWHLTCEWAYIIWVFPSYHDAAVFWLCAFDYDARFKVQNGVSFKGIACVKMRPQRFIWEGITALENRDLRVYQKSEKFNPTWEWTSTKLVEDSSHYEYQMVESSYFQWRIPCNYWKSWVCVRLISSKLVGCESNTYANIEVLAPLFEFL